MKGFSNRFSYHQSFFHCCSLIKIEKENRTTSPEFKQNMPKTSEIALYNEKKTDIFHINPIVSYWWLRGDSNS